MAERHHVQLLLVRSTTVCIGSSSRRDQARVQHSSMTTAPAEYTAGSAGPSVQMFPMG